MKVILFGATGMVGQGVLRECLRDPGVEAVLAVVRRDMAPQPDKVRVLVVKDFLDFSAVQDALTGYDTCFFCLGVSSAGLGEAEYRRVTVDVATAAATTLLRANPGMTFVFVSGRGADGTETASAMWKRVKGQAENAILRMPWKAAYVFRPAYIQPLHGIASRTPLYRAAYAIAMPLYPLLKRLFPGQVTTNEHLARAMIAVARNGAAKRVLESDDINAVALSE